MKALTVKQIETKIHPQAKNLFWFLFVGTKGGNTRIRIINQLRNKPSNKNQLSLDLDIDYKGIEHHLHTLETSNLVTKIGEKYGATYFVSSLFEDGQEVFDEIIAKLAKTGGTKWLR